MFKRNKRKRIADVQKAMLKESHNYKFLLRIGAINNLSEFLHYTRICWEDGLLSKGYTPSQEEAFNRFQLNT